MVVSFPGLPVQTKLWFAQVSLGTRLEKWCSCEHTSPLNPCLAGPRPLHSPPRPPQVFSAAGLDIVTSTRVEHLPEAEKSKHKGVSPLQDFLGTSQDHTANSFPALPAPLAGQPGPTSQREEAGTGGGAVPRLSMEEYFTPPTNPKDYDGQSAVASPATRLSDELDMGGFWHGTCV